MTHVDIFCNALKILSDRSTRSTLSYNQPKNSIVNGGISTAPVHQKRIAKILNISEATLSRGLTKSKASPPILLDKLNERDTIETIEAELSLPGLFCCSTIGEIQELIDHHHGKLVFTGPNELIAVDVSMELLSDVNIQYRLSEIEIGALNEIGDLLDRSTRPIASLEASKFSGANFISSLTHSVVSREKFSKVYYLDPYPEEYFASEESESAAFDHLDETLTSLLGSRGHYKLKMDEYIDEMKSRELLFVVKNFDHFPIYRFKQQGNFISCLIGRLLSKRDITSPLVLLVGECRDVLNRTNSVERIIYSGNEPLDSKQRLNYFEDQLDRFGEIRGRPVSSRPFSTRVRRAKSMFYYETSARPQHTANEIRALAFFASNKQIFSYFDPTNGLSELAGDIDLNMTPDIKEYRNEVNLYIRARTLKQSKRKTDLRILRYVSTGVYWLTRPALDDLITLDSAIGQSAKQDISAVSNAMGRLEETIWTEKSLSPRATGVAEDSLGTERLFASFFVKAVVQDHWMKFDPLDRSIAHYKIARRLYKFRNEKNLLDAEFPLRPHWGRSRHYFVAECLRHCIRAAGTTSSGNWTESKFWHEVETRRQADDFPLTPPDRQLGGCEPSSVVSFCYIILFHGMLNSSEDLPVSLELSTQERYLNQVDSGTRTLSKRHGAYHLTAEMLQLLSAEGRLIFPHEELPKNFKHQFLVDVAFAKLDLGQVDEAVVAFMNVIDHVRIEGSQADLSRSYLQLALAHSVRGSETSLNLAESAIKNAIQIVNELEGSKQVTAVESEIIMPQKTERTSIDDVVNEIRRRVDNRLAYLHYLRGDIPNTLSLFKNLRNEKPLHKDSIHCFIAALMQSDDEDNHKLAMELCVVHMNEVTSEGAQHDGLGFKIAHSHLLRKLGYIGAADGELSQVMRQIYRYGCSERTYIAFLLEAGRNCLSRDIPSRAYAAYLFPCYRRSSELGFARTAEASRFYCIKALTTLLERFNSGMPIEEMVKENTSELAIPVSLDEFADYAKDRLYDPVGAYGFEDPMQTKENLVSEKWIRTALAELEKSG